MPPNHRVVFTPSGLEAIVADGTPVLDAARQAGADLDSVCGGRGICGRCLVAPAFGRFAKWSLTSGEESVGVWSDNERRYDAKKGMPHHHRLGCGATVLGDLVVDVPPESQVHKQVVRKELALGELRVDPIVDLHYIETVENVLGSEMSDLDAVVSALAEQWDLDNVDVSARVLRSLHSALAEGAGAITVAVREGQTVVAAWPGFVDRAAGIAVDIGSTTIAGYLCDLDTGELLATAGVMNPQIRFGEDLMSRVSYVMMHDEGRRELTTVLRKAVDGVVGKLLEAAELSRDRLLDLFLVGNPVMQHFSLGFDPTPLGTAPFTLATSRAVSVRAGDVGLDAPNAIATFGPCIAGHVGADTAAAILAEGPHRSDRVQLLVDVGTNAEIVLGTNAGLFAASSPTGPALEGGEISCGVRATAGAIERVRIDRESLEPRFQVIGSDLWSDEDGFAEEIADLTIAGVCGSGIVEVIAELFLAGVVDRHGLIDGSQSARSDRIVQDGRTFAYVLHRGTRELRITQNDVRAIQLAKAALRAGIDLLRERSGLAELDTIRLAGAFGSHIDPVYAMVLGLIPDLPAHRAGAAGNASGVGAVRALLSQRERDEMAEVTAAVTKIETATEPRFQDLFVAAMAFPHESVPTPHLAQMIDLPEPATTETKPGNRRRRQRPAAKETR